MYPDQILPIINYICIAVIIGCTFTIIISIMMRKCSNTKYITPERTSRIKAFNLNTNDYDVESLVNSVEDTYKSIYLEEIPGKIISSDCEVDPILQSIDCDSEIPTERSADITRYEVFNCQSVVILANTSNATVQTEEVEKDIALQANIIPKVVHPLEYRHQLVQTVARCSPSAHCEESSLKSLFTDRSQFSDSKQASFSHVVRLPTIPVQIREQGNYVGHLEERAYRISRWLGDRTGEPCSSETSDVNGKVSPNVSFLQSNSIIESFIARLKENVRVLPIHKESTANKVEEEKLIFPDRTLNKTDVKQIAHVKEPGKNRRTELNDSKRSPVRNDNDDIHNRNDVTLKKLKENYSPSRTPESSTRAEPIKVKRKFSNYLKGQYRTIEDETISKSFMMMQDLKQVLQQREESRTKGVINN